MTSRAVLTHPVSRYMTTGDTLQTIGPNATLEEAIDIFRSRRIDHIPVLEQGTHLVGIVSVTDVLRLHDGQQTRSAQSTKVTEIMTPNLETLRPTDPMARVARLFADGSFHSLLVTASDGELVGIITSSDVIRALSADA